MKNEEIEILDLDNEVIDSKKIKMESKKKIDNNSSTKTVSRVKKRKNGKIKLFQLIFCSISCLFIIGCFIFYGSRFFKYYRIYNPKPDNGVKVTLLSNAITDKAEIVYEGDGMYLNSGVYIYKGDVKNNYLRYSNLLWRIIKVNSDDTIDIVLDESINLLNWDNDNNKSYLESDIYDYLNEYYLKTLNKDLIINSNICLNEINDLSKITCDKTSTDALVNLLDVTNFLNSINEGKSYLVNDDEIFWLRDRNSENIWHTNGINVSKSASDSFYEIRPVVKLKASNIFYNGDGTKENPYIIEKNKKEFNVGSYVKLGEDTWIVYDVSDDIKLQLNNNLSKQLNFSSSKDKFLIDDEGSVAEYLNTTYLDSLSYKDLLKKTKWLTGNYNTSYKDIKSSEVNLKVGMLNLMDVKFNNTIDNYLLLTFNDEKLVYTYGNVLKSTKNNIYRNIRPCVALSDKTDILSGDGTENNPFIVGE